MKAKVEKIAALSLLGIFVLPVAAVAQAASSPTLDDVLQRLDANLHRYESQVPDFFCSEHVVSTVTYDRMVQTTINDSIFRLKRVEHPGSAATLEESRESKAANGKPVEEKRLHGPTILSGVFSGGLDLVRLDQQSCMRYTLDPVKPGKPYVVHFATLPGRRAANCLLAEDGKGRVLIDPATMQVKRMELTIPNHTILPHTVGVWRIMIDYVPVLLDGKTFWMPTTIASTAVSSYDDTQTVWAFNARYSDYHKLEVTSRIVQPGNSESQ